MSTIGVISLGCSKNLVDTERMLGMLKSAGHTFTEQPETADVLIVNTCGFIESAKQESINTILEMAQYKKTGRCKTLVMTGCLSERYREDLSDALPEVDIFLGVREYEKLPALLGAGAHAVCGSERVLTTPPYRAFLRIGDGCNNRCTYCAIPLIRGALHSVPMEDLVLEAEHLAEGGVTELTVIAQDTSGYGKDLYDTPQLIPLLQRLAKIDALHWIRVLYTYPDTVTPELIRVLHDTPKLVPYLDMPLQHINDALLARMNRRGSKAHICRVLDTIRETAPDFILRTTMMVGFPGETDAQFEELLSFLRDYPFDRVGAFSFSPEEGTKAAALPDQIAEAVKQERLAALLSQQQAISKKKNLARIGTVAEVLIEGSDKKHTFGRSYAEAPDVDGRVILPYNASLHAGDYTSVRFTQALEYDMIGETL